MNEFLTPRWNLDSIYPNLQSEEYKKDLNELNSLIESLDQKLISAENLSYNASVDFLNSFISDYNRLSELSKTIGAYAYIIYSTDTTNTEYMNNLNLMDEISTKIQQVYIKFSSFLSEKQSILPELFAKYPDLQEYKFLLNEIIEDKKHQMSAVEEELASKMSHTGGNAWSLLQEQIISNLKDENGKTFNELRNDANDADPALRAQSWKKEVELLSQNKIALGAALNNLKGETITLNKKRHWDSAIDRALASSRMSKKTLDALIGAMEDALPMWRNYFKAKAKLLRLSSSTVSESAGTKEYPGLAFYDLFAPVQNPDRNAGTIEFETQDSILTKLWKFKEASEYVINKFYSFSKDMGDFAKNAFEKGWIDAEVRQGKVGGAYDEDFPKGHQSRVLTNFTGTFSDIITLSHELGHAYHFSCMKNKAPVFFDYPMTLAESASTFAETIVKQDMLANSSGFDRIKILDIDLTDASQVLVDILCRFYFEQSVFASKENSELTGADFCELMQEAQEKTYGDGLNSKKTKDGTNYEERHDLMWALKCHYYITDLDFYNFPYAFGQLFAAGLYERSKKEGSEFAKVYAEILSNTGSMSCEDLCKQAGFDITTKDFWKFGIAFYEAEVKEFCSYVDSLKMQN